MHMPWDTHINICIYRKQEGPQQGEAKPSWEPRAEIRWTDLLPAPVNICCVWCNPERRRKLWNLTCSVCRVNTHPIRGLASQIVLRSGALTRKSQKDWITEYTGPSRYSELWSLKDLSVSCLHFTWERLVLHCVLLSTRWQQTPSVTLKGFKKWIYSSFNLFIGEIIMLLYCGLKTLNTIKTAT